MDEGTARPPAAGDPMSGTTPDRTTPVGGAAPSWATPADGAPAAHAAPVGDDPSNDLLDARQDPWPRRAQVLAAGLVLATCALIGSAVAQAIDFADAFSAADTTFDLGSTDGGEEAAADNDPLAGDRPFGDDPFGDDEGIPSDEFPGGTFPPFLTVRPDADERDEPDFDDLDDVGGGLSLGQPPDFGSARQTVALAAGGSAEPIVGGLLVAAVLLAVLDDVLTGIVAARRSRLAMITLWTALVVAGVVVVAGGYATYEVLAGPRFHFFGGSEPALALHALTGAGLAGFAGWLALRALEDTGRAELAEAYGADGADDPGGEWGPAT